jgi:hypothetical protein
LTQNESEMLDLFRQLGDEGQRVLLGQLRYTFDNNEPKAVFEKKKAEHDSSAG